MTSTGTLHFSSPGTADSGYYTCTAVNNQGQATGMTFAFVYNSTNVGVYIHKLMIN